MTIGSTLNTITVDGNGATTSFTYPFLMPAASDAVIIYTDASSNATVLLPSQYAITGVGSANGGTVTYPLSGGTPIAAGTYLTIERILPEIQGTSLSNQGPTFASIEGALDYLTMLIQQVANIADRAIVINPADTALPIPLPIASVRANQQLIFDSQGQPTAGLPAGGSVLISAAMQPVVESATRTAAIELLGVSSVMLPFVGSTSIAAAGEILGQCINMAWLGVVPNFGQDCTAAFATALSLLGPGGGEIHFPAGTWSFDSQVVVNYPAGRYSLTITGEGAGNTLLYWPGNNGMVINGSDQQHTVHMRDLTFRGNTQGGVAVELYHANPGGILQQSDFFRVTFDGSTSSDYWNWGIDVFGWCNINYDTVLVQGGNGGNGIAVQGTISSSFKYSIVHNLDKCGFFNCLTGFNYGTYVQGVTLSQCNFTLGTTGILLSAGAIGATQLGIVNSQFATTGNQIVLEAPIATLIAQGNLIYVTNNNAGILFETGSTGLFQIMTGNNFAGPPGSPGGIGIDILATNDGIISGNVFFSLTNGVNLSGTSAGFNVQANNYVSCTNTVVNIGSNSVGVATQ